MLVLTRKTQQSIVVGDADGLSYTLKITVLQVRSGAVRLGFEASTRIVVNRLEVWQRLAGQVAAPPPTAASPPQRPVGIMLSTERNGLRSPDSMRIHDA